MNAAATFIKKSPQAMRSLYLGSLQSRWLCGERRSSGMSELSRLRGSEGYGACADEFRGGLWGVVCLFSYNGRYL